MLKIYAVLFWVVAIGFAWLAFEAADRDTTIWLGTIIGAGLSVAVGAECWDLGRSR